MLTDSVERHRPMDRADTAAISALAPRSGLRGLSRSLSPRLDRLKEARERCPPALKRMRAVAPIAVCVAPAWRVFYHSGNIMLTKSNLRH